MWGNEPLGADRDVRNPALEKYYYTEEPEEEIEEDEDTNYNGD